MSKEIKLIGRYQLNDAIRLAAEKVVTEEGSVYARIPFWFEVQNGGDLILHEEMPEDLSKFICKSGLGGDNPKPIKPKL